MFWISIGLADRLSDKIQGFRRLKSWKSGTKRFNQIIQISAQNTSQIAGKGTLDFKFFRACPPPGQERYFGPGVCFTNSDGPSDRSRTILLWTNNIGGWSVAQSGSPSLLVKQPPPCNYARPRFWIRHCKCIIFV